MPDTLSSLLGLHGDTEDTEQLADNPVWRVGGWCAEFRHAPTEAGYQIYSQQFTVRQLRVALGAWAVLLLLFSLSDYVALGWAAGFWALLAMRVGMAVGLVVLMAAVDRRPELATQGVWTTILEGLGFISFMLLYMLRPDITLWVYAMTLMLLIMLFVFVPNRLCLALGVAVGGAVLTVILLAQGERTWQNLLALAFVLCVPIGIGYLSAWRMHWLQRHQYALLMAARRSNAQLREEMARRAVLEESLRIQATTDPLTGLNNRREYEKRFAHELARAQREDSPFSLAIVDLDFFKRINDTYGHAAGDEVLRTVARLCCEQLRAVDIAGRLGGEEFVILMPDTPLHAAGDVLLRFLRVLEQTAIPFEGQVLRVQATAGVTEWQKGEGHLDVMLQRADEALYAGKQSGRNRVMLAVALGAPQRWTGAAAAAPANP